MDIKMYLSALGLRHWIISGGCLSCATVYKKCGQSNLPMIIFFLKYPFTNAIRYPVYHSKCLVVLQNFFMINKSRNRMDVGWCTHLHKLGDRDSCALCTKGEQNNHATSASSHLPPKDTRDQGRLRYMYAVFCKSPFLWESSSLIFGGNVFGKKVTK